MKLLFDQNLSRRLVSELDDFFPGSVHVTSVGLDIAEDRAIWEFATTNEFTIVSKDSDFRQLSFLYGRQRPFGFASATPRRSSRRRPFELVSTLSTSSPATTKQLC